ncbi:TPA: hypothetical protein JAJ60_002210 [Corynebacterium striatum]|nr:hypothetical protein [Corynebacterium striatum]HAT1199730.1 hypothetical protein [Corynebacterium striatum]HAT1213332.1 hypothetical protein [Corynebacterium striatum]HAT1282098.1 hypothetical protein [Corynebacterium striatum]HAT1397661.1 hypothetical protein [Corynebacterium striatum]
MNSSAEILRNNQAMLEASRQYLDEGFAICLYEQLPTDSEREKIPIDLRPETEREGGSGFHANTADFEELSGWIETANQRELAINIGLVPSKTSRLAVVDLDTQEAVDAWIKLVETDEMFSVSTPGKKRGNEFVHRHGKHVYLKVPPSFSYEKVKGSVQIGTANRRAAAIDVRLFNGAVLAPPSLRSEGRYELDGGVLKVFEAPQRFIDALLSQGVSRSSHTAAAPSEIIDDDLYKEWALQPEHSWENMLGRLGWLPQNSDACGCRVFARPGGASLRSATAHEQGCAVFSDWAVPPLYKWSTEDQSVGWSLDSSQTQTITKWRLWSELEYGGRLKDCATAEGFAYESRLTAEIEKGYGERLGSFFATSDRTSNSTKQLTEIASPAAPGISSDQPPFTSVRAEEFVTAAVNPCGPIYPNIEPYAFVELSPQKTRIRFANLLEKSRGTALANARFQNDGDKHFDEIQTLCLGRVNEYYAHPISRSTSKGLRAFNQYLTNRYTNTNSSEWVQVTANDLNVLLSPGMGEKNVYRLAINLQSHAESLWLLKDVFDVLFALEQILEEDESAFSNDFGRHT